MRALDIVAVDDDPAIVELLSLVFADAGHVVRTASGAAGALALLDDRAPDVLVTDVVMAPTDGVALAHEARARRPDLPVVFVSAYTADRLGVRPLGRTVFVNKPFLAEELLEAVRRVRGA